MEVLVAKAERGKPLRAFTKGTKIIGGGIMSLQRGYSYILEANPGEEFDIRFAPALTPAEMLFLGVFEGKYLNDCTDEFPKEWFIWAAAANKLSPEKANIECNYFKVKSRQPLSVWKQNGWLPSKRPPTGSGLLANPKLNPDERGWFQWYCRYWMGRRIPELDTVQISRWRSFRRHVGAIKKNCTRRVINCRTRERQALLQWAYNPFI